MRKPIGVILSALLVISGCAVQTAERPINTLSAAEVEQGWQLLFDGESTDGWRGYNRDGFPNDAWEVRDGNLVTLAQEDGGSGVDLVTEEQFENFELSIEFKLTAVGNSGILYRVVEREGEAIWYNAPEYQVLDDSAHLAMGTMDMHKHLTGDNYDIHASSVRASNPIGEWNHARIIVNGQHVEHWLNGVMTVEYEIESPEWEALVSESKFADYPNYGRTKQGRIGLQGYGRLVFYRNIKIRRIPQPLFNSRNLDGWRIHGTERWYVENGELVCASGPDAEYGYLATEKIYKDFDLTLEFKQEADGNSGVFFRSSLEGTRITGWQAEVAPPGGFTGGIYESYGRGWLIQPEEEKDRALRMGEWNTMRVRAVGDHVTTWLNGVQMIDLVDEKIGEADGVIALQIHSGGGIRVRWRNLFVTEL
ncbi:MAG: DUF1080 domain-containing protein [Gemmatimonadetes bacterium]|nr:DUF1080 domain-containing protein [Gemmatimonadota bacterium]